MSLESTGVTVEHTTDVLQVLLLYKTDGRVFCFLFFFLDAEVAFCIPHLELKTGRKNIDDDKFKARGWNSAIECLQSVHETLGSALSSAPPPHFILSVMTLSGTRNIPTLHMIS